MFEALQTDLATGFRATGPWVAAMRLLAAIILSGIIGIEREWRGKPAGLRTHILVGLAAALFVMLGQEVTQLDFGGTDDKRIDPLRLIEAVTSGVAFLAAGIIFTAKGEVRNITTGASLWLAGAVGLGCGAGQIPLAAMASVMVVIVLMLLREVERLLGWHD
ncbi:putative Mg2+ transporter-C (MgtC) family protein [Limimaricola soesokkakensis]|uniref:Protein MgtC n=1 Tax=Limimaricola soesokkakensis TaxID=1343159 RepID=A0A1X6YAM1_9RHOB|nr:MgtC/SapB family protein [Limimaricola soesokkakensis]PSK87162.1 putative Mg2+ transporter-C (MgtC) family protein [Limimaricola soesokkakensis]SLN15214.1 putative Mg(2+) transport ATPase [Limimaricola soesokkakensis]